MLDSDLLAFVQSGVSISLAASAADRRPTMSRGLGCKLIDGGRQLGVFVKRSQSAELCANIGRNGRVANVFSLPSNNRTVQLKGADARMLAFDAADQALIAVHLADFLLEVLPHGLPEAVVRALFAHTPDDLLTVVYTPGAVYTQTPGPRAGAAVRERP